MKQHIAVFVMVCLLVCVSVFPSVAQDATVAPDPCNADQVKQVTDTALQWGDQMNTVSQKAYDKTLDGDTQKMLDWGDLYVSFFNDIYPNLPTCIDGVIYGNAVGLMLNRQMNLETMLVLNDEQNATKTGDADVNQALQAAFDIQDALAKVGVSAINAVVTQVKSGTGIPNWLPACAADQTELGTQITDLEQTYAGLQPAMQAYLENGTVDKDTYIAVLKLVNDTATLANANPAPCADDYTRLVNDIYTFGDTLTTLTLGQIAPYMSGDVNADWFNTLLQYCNDTLNSYLPEATATAES
jgi:hypothetical protein